MRSLQICAILWICCAHKSFGFLPAHLPLHSLTSAPSTPETSQQNAPTVYHNTRLYAKSGKKKKKPKGNTICVNRRARFQYEILDTLEAGISLKGTEVKSIRDGKMNLQDAFVRVNRNGRSAALVNCHIAKHTMSGEYFQHEEKRPRDLLLHKSEAKKLLQKTESSGMTIVPLKAYFNDDNRVKLQIGVARGKNVRDKRATIKERDAKRETSRIIKNFRI